MIGALLMKVGARRGFAAIDRLDIDYLVRLLADDVVAEFPGHNELSWRYVGKQAVADLYRRWLGGMAAVHNVVVHTAVENPLALGLSNTVITELEAEETRADGRTGRGRYVDVSEIRRGKLVASRTYVWDIDAVDAMYGPAQAAAEPPTR